MSQSALLVVIALLAFVAGGGLGFALAARRRGEADKRTAAAEAELNTYRENVTGHFQETAVRFRELGEQYRSLHEHLAGGAQTLCKLPTDEAALSFAPLPEIEGPTTGRPAPDDDLPSMSATGPETQVESVVGPIERSAGSEGVPSPPGPRDEERVDTQRDLAAAPEADPDPPKKAESDPAAPGGDDTQATPRSEPTERTIH